MLLPLLFIIVAALFATLAQRMGTRDGGAAAAARLHASTSLGSLAGVAAFALMSWLRAAADVVVRRSRSPPRCRCC